MFTSAERLIAIRNLKPKRKEGFLKVISIFSFVGIMLGVSILIIVMSVMNGFRTELTNKILGFNPHLTIKPYNNEKINSKFLDSRNERIKMLGEEKTKEIEKRIFLQSIDLSWKSHIQYLEQLRQVIGLRSYGQRDPLVEYKKEAFHLFENLLNKLKIDFVTILINLKVIQEHPQEKENIKPVAIDPKYIGKKMSRNEPCFCGSGKKFKRCCGSL